MLLDFLPILAKIFDRVIPDPQAAADAKLKVLELAQSSDANLLDADIKLATGQMDVNRVEAASTALFVAGWRPFLGWVCGVAFAYKFVVLPFLLFLVALFGKTLALPDLSVADLSPILMGMLGLGAMRTVEKLRNVA